MACAIEVDPCDDRGGESNEGSTKPPGETGEDASSIVATREEFKC